MGARSPFTNTRWKASTRSGPSNSSAVGAGDAAPPQSALHDIVVLDRAGLAVLTGYTANDRPEPHDSITPRDITLAHPVPHQRRQAQPHPFRGEMPYREREQSKVRADDLETEFLMKAPGSDAARRAPDTLSQLEPCPVAPTRAQRFLVASSRVANRRGEPPRGRARPRGRAAPGGCAPPQAGPCSMRLRCASPAGRLSRDHRPTWPFAGP